MEGLIPLQPPFTFIFLNIKIERNTSMFRPTTCRAARRLLCTSTKYDTGTRSYIPSVHDSLGLIDIVRRHAHAPVCALHDVSPRDLCMCVLPGWQMNVNVNAHAPIN